MIHLFQDSKKYALTGCRLATIGVTVAVGLLTASAASAGPVNLDRFLDGFGAVGVGQTQNFAAPSAVGGSRTLQVISGSIGAALGVDSGNAGVLTVASGTQTGATGSVTYDGNGAGLSDMDLTVGGQGDSFSIELLSIDIGSVILTLIVFAQSEQTTLSQTAGLSSLGVPLVFYFSAFSPSSPAIFEQAEKVVLSLAADSQTDATLRFGGVSCPDKSNWPNHCQSFCSVLA
jgi:hypothetical protein